MIPLYTTVPVVLTKDRAWAKIKHKAEPGAIIVLPQDAILVIMPEKKEEE